MSMRKELLWGIIPMVAACLFMAGPVQAENAAEPAINVKINDRILNFSEHPIIVNGTTLVPLRSVFEALDTKVDWDGVTQTVTAKKENTTIRLTIGQSVGYKDNQKIPLLSPSMIVDGATMIPLRFVAESLGATVGWNDTTRVVSIDSAKPEQTVSEINSNDKEGKGVGIIGDPIAKPEELYHFAAKYNPMIPKELSEWYVKIGQAYHIRGDIAFLQMCKETNFFRFGGDVSQDQNNFAGIGAIGSGEKGNKFTSLREGVQAHIQHLYAYATKDSLPKGETLIDPRFNLVKRGIATTWQDLGGKWAISPQYGQEIVSLFQRMENSKENT